VLLETTCMLLLLLLLLLIPTIEVCAFSRCYQ
jgi:hypothetical protein